MSDEKIGRLITIGGWTGPVLGSIYGLILILAGYFFKWGPGSGIEGGIAKVICVSEENN